MYNDHKVFSSCSSCLIRPLFFRSQPKLQSPRQVFSQAMGQGHERQRQVLLGDVGHDAAVARFSDDGEPGGTAGRPIMELLIREDLVDAAVVVTRYFGGTLLGSGGLTRAYSQTAAEALRAAGLLYMVPHTEMIATVEYQHFGAVEQAMRREGLPLQQTVFTDVVSFTVRVPVGNEATIEALLADLTAGAALIETGAVVYLADSGAAG